MGRDLTVKTRELMALPFFLLSAFFFSVSPASRLYAQIELGGYLGKGVTVSSDLHIVQPSQGTDVMFYDVHYEDRSFQFPLYYGLRLGYFLPGINFIGIETEFIHLKVYSNPNESVSVSGRWQNAPVAGMVRLGDRLQEFSISHGLNLQLLNLLMRYGFPKDAHGLQKRIHAVARIGVGAVIPHTESTIEQQHQEQYELRGPAFQASAAGDVKLVGELAWFLECKYTVARVQNAGVPSGRLSTTLQSLHVVSGFAIQF
ncbi:MAG: hypothetical protein ACPL4I_01290 [Bacteroidota bacterium]